MMFFSGLSVPLLIEGATFQKVHDGAKVLMSWKELFSCVKKNFSAVLLIAVSVPLLSLK